MKDIAPLAQTLVDTVLEEVRKRISSGGLGVSMLRDPNGAWGPAGAVHLTVRYSDPGYRPGLMEAHFILQDVSSTYHDEQNRRLDREDK